MYIDVIYGQDAGSCQAQTRWGGDGDHSFRHSSCLGSGAALLSISSVVENSVKPLLTPDKWTNAKYAEVRSWHILHILHMIICKICRIWTVNYLFAYLFAYCSIFILHILHILHMAICNICRIWTVHYYFAYLFAYCSIFICILLHIISGSGGRGRRLTRGLAGKQWTSDWFTKLLKGYSAGAKTNNSFKRQSDKTSCTQ